MFRRSGKDKDETDDRKREGIRHGQTCGETGVHLLETLPAALDSAATNEEEEEMMKRRGAEVPFQLR